MIKVPTYLSWIASAGTVSTYLRSRFALAHDTQQVRAHARMAGAIQQTL